MYAEILTEDDVEMLHSAIDVALAEAAEREMVLTSSDIIARIFDVFSMGERDPCILAHAIIFSGGNRYRH